MTDTGYLAIAERRTELIRKGLQGSAFVAQPGGPAINAANLFDEDTGDLVPLPPGYTDLGILTDAGVKASRAVKSTDLSAWGFTDPVRSDVTSDTTTVVVECQETKLETIGVYIGVDPEDMTPNSNGSLEIPQPSIVDPLYYRLLVVSVDESPGGEIVIAKFLPAAKVTSITDQVFANGSSATTWGVTFTGYVDTTLGFAVDHLFGGAGWDALLGDEDVPRVVTCSTSASGTGEPPANTVLTATAGTFSAYDIGRSVSGGSIPEGTTIVSLTSDTEVVISQPTTATVAGVAVTVS